jgi:hypothetical protein
MDLKLFSGDAFDVREWINATFRQADARDETREQLAASLVTKLQLMIAKMNSNLEEQADAVASTAPRLTRDVDVLKQEASALANKMTVISTDIDRVTAETGSSMQQLVALDAFKTRIQAARKAIAEADSWTTLVAEAEDALEATDIDLAAEKLRGLRNALTMLSHVVDLEARVEHVEGVKNRLEAICSPQLVDTFSACDAERAIKLVGLFEDMERSQQLLRYYRKCLKARLLKAWARTVDDNQHLTVVEWAPEYFSTVEGIIREQVPWFESVFTNADARENLILVLTEVYFGLDPRMDFCIEAGLKTQAEPLSFLVRLKALVNSHAETMSGLLCTSANQSRGEVRELARTLFAPFRSYVAAYGQMESSQLLSELVSTTVTSKDIIDELRNISLSVSKMVLMFSSAAKRCCTLTEACAFPALLAAFEDCLASYCERYTTLMRRLDKRKAAGSSSILQQSLSLNQRAGEFLLQLEQLDINLAIEFLEKTKPFLGEAAGREEKVFEQHHLFLLDSQAVAKLESFHATVQKGVNFPVLGPCLKILTRVCSELQNSTFGIIFHPIESELAPLSDLPAWKASVSASVLPDLGFAPLEYITQVGQYLMTLPQHLEPFMTTDSKALSRALQECVFPYCGGAAASDETPADFILSCVSRATCENYQAAILRIAAPASVNACKQLATDISYLGDILEDLGHPLSEGLKVILTLLRLPSGEFTVQSSALPQKLVSAVRQLRNLHVSKGM